MKLSASTVIVVLILVGCGGGGGPTVPVNELQILGFNPTSAAPGHTVKINCKGVTGNETAVDINLGENRIPASSVDAGIIHFYAPALTPGVYAVTFNVGEKESQAANFTINQIPDQPYTQAEFAEIATEGVKELADTAMSIFTEIDTELNIYNDAQISDLETAFADLDKLSDVIKDEINQLPPDQAKVLQSLFNESGILALFEDIHSGQRLAEYLEDNKYPDHHALFKADQLSALITNTKTIIDTAIFVSAFFTFGQSAAIGAVIAGFDFVLSCADYYLDSLIPTDLQKELEHPITIKLTNSTMNPGAEQPVEYWGYFRCQDKFMASTVGFIVDQVLTLLGPFSLPEEDKDAIENLLNDLVKKAGLADANQLVGDSFQPVDDYLFKNVQYQMDISIYTQPTVQIDIPGLNLFVSLFQFFGLVPTPDNSVEIDDINVASYDYITERIHAKAVGSVGIHALGYSMTPKSFLFWGFETQEWAQSATYNLTVNSGTTSQSPVAKAKAEPNPQTAGQSVHFMDDSSYDPDGGAITKYEWDWENDGTYDSATGPDKYHSWSTPGTYYVQFRVTDDEGETDTLDQPLEIVIETQPSGNGWARTWGGSDGFDEGYAVAVDGSGNVYVTGYFKGTVDFDPGSGVDNHSSGGRDAFLSKFDSSGAFKWARTWGGSGDDYGHGVAVDGSGNVFVTGWFPGTVDFDPGGGVDNHSAGYIDVFLSKFDSSGAFKWARTWGGGSHGEIGYSVAVDGSGNVYVTGPFYGTADFDPGSGVDNHTSNGEDDVFLSQLDTSGTFKWARTWGGSDWDEGFGVAVDGSGNVYVSGYLRGTVDFDPGSGVDNHTSNGTRDVFLSKFDSSGDFEWARTWGGSDWDEGCGVAVDGSGNVYVTGEFHDTVDFDTGSGVDNHTSNAEEDVFLSKFDSSGDFKWARTWGGSIWWDHGCGVAVDASGNVYVTSDFQDTVDFDPGGGVDNRTSNGYDDVFLSKFDSSGASKWARTWGGSDYDYGHGVAVDGSGNVYVTGEFNGTVDFDPGSGVDNHTSNGNCDVFLSKFQPDGNW